MLDRSNGKLLRIRNKYSCSKMLFGNVDFNFKGIRGARIQSLTGYEAGRLARKKNKVHVRDICRFFQLWFFRLARYPCE